MHVGSNKENCELLKIHDIEMLATNKQKYLGDIVCRSRSNNENIKERCKVGYQAISQIKSFMKDVSLGTYAIQIGLVLRDSIFLSKMLLNSKVWHSLTKLQIQEIEVLNNILLRHT